MLARAIAPMAPIEFGTGDIIVAQGDKSEAAYFLTEGTVQVYAETRYGTVPLATLQAPRLIGEIGVLANLPRTASLRAATPAKAYRLSQALILELGQQVPSLLLSIIAQLGRQITSINKTIGLYTNALGALERREVDFGILDDLARPPPELAEFAAVFRRFATQIVHKRRQYDELAAAALIQQSLLPQADRLPTSDPRFSLCARMRPAREVGGDFYEYFMIDDDRLAFAIGDICGKGVPASLFMSIVVTVLRATAREHGSVADVAAHANALLCRDNPSSMFATAFYGVLDLNSGKLDYCNCGHNAPLHISAANGLSCLGATGLPLGLYADRSAGVAGLQLAAGDRIVLFTDGVTEAISPSGEEFGDERLAATLEACRDQPLEAVIAGVFADVDAFAGDAEQADDITCIVLARR